MDINLLHTTPLGVKRIKENLSLENDDVVSWCKNQMLYHLVEKVQRGKNCYYYCETSIICVNNTSNTIITAHKNKKRAL